jgi:hypothetical protein
MIPIYVDMGRYRDSIEQTIADSYAIPVPPTWREFASMPLVFCIDGLELLPSAIQLTALSHIAALMSTMGPQARWVLSCRSEALPLFRPWFSSAEAPCAH